MEVEQVKTETAPANAETETGSETETVAETPVDPQLKSTNERLLNESKKNREAYLKAKKELDDLKQRQMSEQGKFKELYEKANAELAQIKKQSMLKDISFAVKLAAEKSGFVKPDNALKLGNPDLLQYDEATGGVFGVDTFVDELKKEYPQLFSTSQKTVINPVSPMGVTKEQKLTAADVQKLGKVEKSKAWAQAYSAKKT